MTHKQQAFVAEYLVDLNATQAAIRAGYSPHTATEQAHELKYCPAVAAAIAQGRAQRTSRVAVKQDDVVHQTSLLAFSSIDHYAVDEEGALSLAEGAPEGAMAAVQTVRHRKRVRMDRDGAVVTTYDTEIRLWDKPKALFLIGRHVGLFADRVEHTGPNGSPIEAVTRIERVIVSLPCGALAGAGDTNTEPAIPAPDHVI